MGMYVVRNEKGWYFAGYRGINRPEWQSGDTPKAIVFRRVQDAEHAAKEVGGEVVSLMEALEV